MRVIFAIQGKNAQGNWKFNSEEKDYISRAFLKNINGVYWVGYIRPNPEDRKIRKLEGQIYEEMAKLLKNWKAEFDHKAEE